MNRKEFIKTCSLSCLYFTGFSTLLQSCSGTKYVQSQAKDNKLRVAKTDFYKENNPLKKVRDYILVKTENLNYPIVLYRVSENNYVALLLECPHQNMELNVHGDIISCPAHGSEFSNTGEVLQGPAEQNLKRYTVTQDTDNIYIHLI